jgi:hypothetical protein
MADLEKGSGSAGDEKLLIRRREVDLLEMRNACSRGGKLLSWR